MGNLQFTKVRYKHGFDRRVTEEIDILRGR